jgi:hypothetical protein
MGMGSQIPETGQGSESRTGLGLGPFLSEHSSIRTVIQARKSCCEDGRPGCKSAPNSWEQRLVFGAAKKLSEVTSAWVLGSARQDF